MLGKECPKYPEIAATVRMYLVQMKDSQDREGQLLQNHVFILHQILLNGN